MSPTILTLTGGYFDFTNPEVYRWDIKAIAKALSHICRFTGQIDRFYSVAQHSVYVADLLPREIALQGLLHDAAESVLGDVSSPLKSLLPEYKALERRVEASLFKFYGLPEELDSRVKHADLVMLATEKRDLMGRDDTGGSWALLQGIEPMLRPLRVQPDWIAEMQFLRVFRSLTEGRFA